MLALPHRFLKEHWTKSRRRCQNRHIAHRDRLLVSVEPDEFVIVRNFHLLLVLALKAAEAAIEPIFENISHCDQLHPATGGAQRLVRRTGTASAATNQRD